MSWLTTCSTLCSFLFGMFHMIFEMASHFSPHFIQILQFCWDSLLNFTAPGKSCASKESTSCLTTHMLSNHLLGDCLSIIPSVLTCPALTAPSHGRFRNSQSCGNAYGTWCRFECDTGYSVTGSASRRCIVQQDQTSASWSGSATGCQSKWSTFAGFPRFCSPCLVHGSLYTVI